MKRIWQWILRPSMSPISFIIVLLATVVISSYQLYTTMKEHEEIITNLLADQMEKEAKYTLIESRTNLVYGVTAFAFRELMECEKRCKTDDLSSP